MVYFDAHLDDGSSLVVVFYTKNPLTPDGLLEPFVSVELTRPEVSGLKHLLARLRRFDGAYLRFTGIVQLEHFVQGRMVEDVSDHGIWELMYFGHTIAHDDKLRQHT